jgi:predicted nucleic acid-binding protein
MTARYFVDTNVLLYAGSNAREDRQKREIARQLLQHPEIGFSAQVAQEFYDAARKGGSMLKVIATVVRRANIFHEDW